MPSSGRCRRHRVDTFNFTRIQLLPYENALNIGIYRICSRVRRRTYRIMNSFQ